MLRWLIVVFLALIIFSGLQKWLEKIGIGRLPGDFRFRLFGREFFIPITSTLLLSMVAAGVGRCFPFHPSRPKSDSWKWPFEINLVQPLTRAICMSKRWL